MEESLFMDAVRSLFALLDRMVYSLITIFYNTISDLSAAQLVQTSVISEITSRMYALLGVFMLFRVSFSLINYIVDPDQIADKTKGGGALIKNIVVTFVLIVSTPFCFNLVYEAQAAILADQVIPRFILGIDVEDSTSDAGGGGYKMQMAGCENEIVVENMGNFIGLAIFKPFFVDAKVEEPTNENIGAFYNHSHDTYCYAGLEYGESSVRNLLRDSDLYNSPKGASFSLDYTIDYSFFLSTAIGVVVALIMLGYCFDIATRTIKLLFLEIIAPIPIISYIDPNSSKNGMFIKWLKEVGGTWISLFTRLVSLFLAVFVIQQITAVDGKLYFLDGYEFNGNVTWLKILIIIGALIFAKQLPKMLENILGFKLGGNMTLNPFKKLEGEALGGRVFGTAGKMVSNTGKFAANTAKGVAVGAGIGLGTSLGSAGANFLAQEGGFKEKLRSAGKGLGTGAFYGITDGFKAGYSGKRGSILKSIEHNSRNRNLSEDLRKGGEKGGLIGFTVKNKMTDLTGKRGSSGTTDMMKDRMSSYDAQHQMAMQNQHEASQTIAAIRANNSQWASELSKAFSRDVKYNADGTIERNEGRVKWANDISQMSASDYLRDNDIQFRDSFESEEFERAFNSMRDAEMQYRNAYNEAANAEYNKTKLSKQKDKFDKIGK